MKLNRAQRRAEGMMHLLRAADNNAFHWAAIKTIKRDYDALPDAEKAIRKPSMARQIDDHLLALGVTLKN